jgi:hypothetical protein
MARTADQISADIDTISASLGSAQQRVRFADGRELQYYSTEDKLKAKAALQAELKEVMQTNKTGSTSVAQHRRGDGPSGPPRWYW